MLRAVSIASILLLAGAGQDTPPKLDPGNVILLSLGPPAEASPVLASALVDSNPLVRTAAARVAGVNYDTVLVPTLVKALAVEQEDVAAAEQIRALFLIKREDALTEIDQHAARIGGRAVIALAEWLARYRPEVFASRLPQLAPAVSRDRGSLAPVVAYAARQPAVRQEVLRAWMRVAPDGSWQSVLDGALFDSAELQASDVVLSEGLRFPEQRVREDAVWFLVRALARGLTLPPAITEAARPATEAAAPLDWESFGRELISGLTGNSPLPDRSDFLRTQPSLRRFSDPAILALLSDAEASIVRKYLQSREPTRHEKSVRPDTYIPARTVSEWMPGVIASTAAAAGCRVTSSVRFGVARVTYDEFGRVSHMEGDTSALSNECHPVLAALARTGLADADRPIRQGQQQWQLLPLSSAFLECTSRPFTGGTPFGEDAERGVVKPPRKVRDVRPHYPEALIRQRVQGTVVAEAVVADTGCVRTLRVITSSGAAGLDVSALQAVSGWRFEPTTLDGKPVPVYMTVTVKFSLQ